MNTYFSVLDFIRNKFIAILVLVALGFLYRSIPDDQPVPFAELLYAVILISSVTILGPFMRLLVFNEAAVFAESGGLDNALKMRDFTPALIHYWFATLICYATSILCVSSLLSS